MAQATRPRKKRTKRQTPPRAATQPVVVRPLIKLPSFSLPKRKAPAIPKELTQRERLYLIHDKYQPGYDIFSVRRKDLMQLDVRARYTRRRTGFKWFVPPLGLLCGVGVGFVPLAFLVALALIPPFWPLLIVGAGLIGLVLGYVVMRRMFPNEAVWFCYYNGHFEPIFPTPMLQDHRLADNKNKPMIMRGTLMKSISSQPFVRRWLRITRKSGRARQMNLTGILLFAGAMVALLVFFGIANSG